MLLFSILIYASALVAANLSLTSVAMSHPEYIAAMAAANAFVLIGLDLTLRDILHRKLTSIEMFLLICACSAMTYVLNGAAGQIAVASAVAFLLSSAADWAVFSAVRGAWARRSHMSNLAGAAVDSLVFPLLAGYFSWELVALQFMCKTAGAAIWTYVLQRRVAA